MPTDALRSSVPPAAATDTATVELLTNQLLLLATIVGAIAALPALIQFILDRAKRRERLDLAIEDAPTPDPRREPVRLVGLEALQADIADLVDRVAHPERYANLRLGNEILIIGPEQSGRRSLARWIAQQGGVRRIVTVHNPRFSEALARAKRLVRRSGDEKILLLVPNIDDIFDEPEKDEDEEIQAELDALVEAIANKSNILVVGTARSLAEGDDLDNLFGFKVLLPGAPAVKARPASQRPSRGSEHDRLLRAVARDALERAGREGFPLDGLSIDDALTRLLARVANPAEIEDTLEAARTTSIYLHAAGTAAATTITPDVLDKAIRRVMGPGAAPSSDPHREVTAGRP